MRAATSAQGNQEPSLYYVVGGWEREDYGGGEWKWGMSGVGWIDDNDDDDDDDDDYDEYDDDDHDDEDDDDDDNEVVRTATSAQGNQEPAIYYIVGRWEGEDDDEDEDGEGDDLGGG
jgi:hypothetical protein